MKTHLLTLSSLFVVGAFVLLQSNASGPAASGNRATGAPGDGANSCVTCHNSGTSFGTVSISLDIQDGSGSTVTEYMPDSTYSLTVTVDASSGTPSGYGYSMICLDDANDDNYDGWSNASSGTGVTTSASRTYVEHTSTSSSNTFTVDWTAPSEGTGDMTFYIGANAVDATGNNQNDNAAIDNFSITEMIADTTDSIPTGIDLAQLDMKLSVYPNPMTNIVNIQGSVPGSKAQIYSINGNLVQELTLSNSSFVDVSEFETGVYFLRTAENQVIRLVKL